MHRSFAGLVLSISVAATTQISIAQNDGPTADNPAGTSANIGVMGRVARPGVYRFEQPLVAIDEIVQRAGGTSVASCRVRVVRNGRQAWGQWYHCDRSSSDRVLRNGDIVILHSTPNASAQITALNSTAPATASDALVQVAILNLDKSPLIFAAPTEVRTAGDVVRSLRQPKESLVSVVSVAGQFDRSERSVDRKPLTPYDIVVFDPLRATPESIPQGLLEAARPVGHERSESESGNEPASTWYHGDTSKAPRSVATESPASEPAPLVVASPTESDEIALRDSSADEPTQPFLPAAERSESDDTGYRIDSPFSEVDDSAPLTVESDSVVESDSAPIPPADVLTDDSPSVEPSRRSADVVAAAPIPPQLIVTAEPRETVPALEDLPLIKGLGDDTVGAPNTAATETQGVNLITGVGIATLLAILVALVAGSFGGSRSQGGYRSTTGQTINGRSIRTAPRVPAAPSIPVAESPGGPVFDRVEPAVPAGPTAAQSVAESADDSMEATPETTVTARTSQTLEALIQNQFPIRDESLELPRELEFFGTPAGPRKIRIDAAHEQPSAPHIPIQSDRPARTRQRQTVATGEDSHLGPHVFSTTSVDGSSSRQAEGGLLDRALSQVHGAER